MQDDEHEELDGKIVRPFLLTKGRTRSSGVQVVMESLIDRGDIEPHQFQALDQTKRSIFELLSDRLSAAEIAAKLALPLGVICVLVGDMGGDGILVVHKTADAGDVDLLRRLIDGVRSL